MTHAQVVKQQNLVETNNYMRQLFPTRESDPAYIPSDKEQYVTKSDYDALVALVNEYEQALDAAIDNFDQWKADIQSAFQTGTLTTEQLNAINADISSIVSTDKVSATTSVTSEHFQGNTAYLQNITAACKVATPVVCAVCKVETPKVETQCVVTDDITVNNAVNYTTTCTTNANIDNANISCATVTDVSIHEASVFCLDADTVQACTGCIDTIATNDITSCFGNINRLTTEFFKHNTAEQAQTLVTPDDFYVELPYFSNGSYRLISKDAQENELWSITVHNESGNNFVITWSSAEALANYLEDLYIYQDKFYFHGNSNGKAQTIYHISDTLENDIDPTIYTNGWPFDPTSLDVQKYWVFQFSHGTKFFRNVSFANDTAITSPLRLINCDDVECANLPKTYDTTEDTNVVLYQPDQNVNTTSCVTFNRITTADYTDPDTGITTTSLACHPHLEVTEDIVAPSLNVSCACIDKTTVPNGLVIDCEGTFIKSTGEDTFDYVNPIATFKADECWECADCGLVAYDKNTNSLRPADDVHIVGNLTVECVLTACGPVIACQDVTVACDLHVNGDAFIAGTLHYTEEETINSTADNIILRQNNPTPLAAGQHSGLIINNATATSSTAIAVDCTGTVRVGNASATNTTYTDIYLSEADGKWYSDAELTTEVIPNGDLTAWSSTDKTDDYTHYTNAVFTVYSITATQPLATRDEEANMVDEMPVIWDASCNRIVTTAPANGCACMGLVTCINEVTGCLGTTWQDMHPAAVSCHYATMADFNADISNIPNDAFVIIDECNDYVYSEDR